MMYIKVDRDGRVIEVYEQGYDGLIDTNWKPEGSLMDDRYVYKYKYTDGEVIERTQEEMDADLMEQEAKPTLEQRVAALEEKVDGEMNDQQEALRILGL